MSDQLRKGLEGLLTAVFPVDWYKFRTYQPDLDERWCQYAEGVIKSKLEAQLARTGPPAPDALRTWIAGAQFMVTPKEAPDGNAPLHVVTVEGLLKWLDEREIGR